MLIASRQRLKVDLEMANSDGRTAYNCVSVER
jgi:hypothetical protein